MIATSSPSSALPRRPFPPRGPKQDGGPQATGLRLPTIQGTEALGGASRPLRSPSKRGGAERLTQTAVGRPELRGEGGAAGGREEGRTGGGEKRGEEKGRRRSEKGGARKHWVPATQMAAGGDHSQNPGDLQRQTSYCCKSTPVYSGRSA